MSSKDRHGAARAIARAVRDLPVADLPEGVTFSRITDSSIRAASDAKIGGTDQRVLEFLLRTVKVDEAGRLYVSQPSGRIASVLGVRESNVRRSLARLCSAERCHGHPLLEVVAHGQPGISAIYRILFDWAAPLALKPSQEAERYSASDLEHIRAAGMSFVPPHTRTHDATRTAPTARESEAPEEESSNKTERDSNNCTSGTCPF